MKKRPVSNEKKTPRSWGKLILYMTIEWNYEWAVHCMVFLSIKRGREKKKVKCWKVKHCLADMW